MALRQICSHPKAVAKEYREVPGKLLALDSLLPQLIERSNEKVIVWSFFRTSLDAIADRYRHYNVVRYDGSVDSMAQRREAVRAFQEDDYVRLFVGNPAAAGAGLTLHAARVAIYESLSNQAAHYLQSLDRIHRRGQVREVEYIVLLTDQTIDIAEYDRILKKERASQQLLGDQIVEPLTRETMLSDLLNSLSQLRLTNE
jgi:SNF2 family DNA or RNA helicase